MGSITDIARWEPSIYMLQDSDPILGGEDGASNIQAKQLANRTAYLLEKALLEHASTGAHEITDAMVAVDADIAESKLDLDYGTTYLYARAESGYAKIIDLLQQVNQVLEEEGYQFSSYGKAVPLTWQYSDYGFSFELFTNSFSMRYLDPVAVTNATAGSDTITCETTESLTVGKEYTLASIEGVDCENITVAEILTETTFRSTEVVANTRTSGFLASTSWLVSSGTAVAENASTYYSTPTKVLNSYDQGKLLIRREKKQGYFGVYWREVGTTSWTKCSLLQSKSRSEEFTDDEFLVPGGTDVEFRITLHGAVTPVRVDHFSIFPVGLISYIAHVKTPVNVSPAVGATDVTTGSVLTGTDFRSLYGETFRDAQFQVSTDVDFTSTVLDEVTAAGVTYTIPAAVLDLDTSYYWRCRYTDGLGNTSRWSEATQFTTGSVFAIVSRPVGLSPVGTAVISDDEISLHVSPMAMDFGTANHIATQWQISTDEAFGAGDLVLDSGEDTTNLASNTVLAINVPNNELLYWRVRFKAQNSGDAWVGWSAWSPVYRFIWQEELVGTSLFAADTYTGTGASQDVNNGIDLDQYGGVVWRKAISAPSHHYIVSDSLGVDQLLSISSEDQKTTSTSITSFNNNGFTMGDSSLNSLDTDYVAYTFRKTANYCTVITWTGNGVHGRAIPHELGTAPKMVIGKAVNVPANTFVYHENASGNLLLNSPAPQTSMRSQITAVTPSTIYVAGDMNIVNCDYVAVLFADMPSISKTGTYVGTETASFVHCGFTTPPRFTLVKCIDGVGDWMLWDSSRGFGGAGVAPHLTLTTAPEESPENGYIDASPYGFTITAEYQNPINMLGRTYIYLAIA